ncbi:MAG: hypothetical protein R2856_28590 [Caldilineaceae bacterium]
MSDARVEMHLAVRMIALIITVHVAVALLGFVVGKALGRSPEMIGAHVVIAVFGNVGNFGLPIIEFRLGSDAGAGHALLPVHHHDRAWDRGGRGQLASWWRWALRWPSSRRRR